MISFETSDVKTSYKKQIGGFKRRCSLVLLKKQVKTLQFRKDHLEALKKTPFWKLIEAITTDKIVENHCTMDSSVMTMILNCYVKGDKSFLFGKKYLTLKAKHAKLLLGINDGEEEININYYNIERSNFLLRHFPERESKKAKDYKLSPTLICTRIQAIIHGEDQREINDVASLTTLLVLASFLVPTSSSYIPWAYINIIFDLDKISTYNWSHHIVDRLIHALENRKDDNVDKCVLLLPYWLCERINILKPIKEDDIPRLLKWDLSALSKVLNKSDFNSVMKKKKFHHFSKATTSERETLWGIRRNEDEEVCLDKDADLRIAGPDKDVNLGIEGPEINNEALHEKHVYTDFFDTRVDDTQQVENTCCKNLKDELINKLSTIEEKDNEIAMLRTELLEIDNEIATLRTELLEEQRVGKGLSAKLDESSSQIEAKDYEIERLKSELAIVVQQSTTRAELIEKNKEIESLRAELSEDKEQLQRLRKLKSELVKLLEKSSEQPQEQQIGTQILSSPTTELNLKLLEAETEIESLKKKLSTMVQEMEMLRAQQQQPQQPSETDDNIRSILKEVQTMPIDESEEDSSATEIEDGTADFVNVNNKKKGVVTPSLARGVKTRVGRKRKNVGDLCGEKEDEGNKKRNKDPQIPLNDELWTCNCPEQR